MLRQISRLFTLLLLFALMSPAGNAFAYHMVAEDEGDIILSTAAPQYYSYMGNSPYAQPQAEQEAAAPAITGLTYVVNPGDTLYKIAESFGSSVETLSTYNDLANPNLLRVGQALTIPVVQNELPLLEGKEPVIEKVLTSTLTAYTAGKESTGKTPSHPQYGITYSGVRAEEGRTVAVDPKVIPLGSIVYIEGVGIRKAEDTGSAIKGSKIDVFMEDVGEARTFGLKRNVKVFVLAAV